MKKLNLKRGFTLIELLVVVAIIGILASVVLASLSTARNKGNDAKIQGQLSSMRSAAEIYYSTNNSYGTSTLTGVGCSTPAGMWTDTASGLNALALGTNYPGGTAPSCNSNGTAWAAWHALSSDSTKYFCVDSSGAAKTESSAPGSTVVACP
jgi:prepilin-type N-terminal cleavage/methylation domain-containing protein